MNILVVSSIGGRLPVSLSMRSRSSLNFRSSPLRCPALILAALSLLAAAHCARSDDMNPTARGGGGP